MTRTILFSILLIGVLVVAVAGITFAVFSDNEASDVQYFATGSVDIEVGVDVDPADGYFDTILDMPEDMAPGDYEGPQAIDITNTGTLPIFYHTWIYTSGEIFGCDPNPACNLKVDYTGPSGDYALAPLETETINLSANFPLCAGNACQNKSGNFRMFVHAWQQKNLEDYTCIKLEDKDADWLPDPSTPAHGNMCYMVDGTDLKVVVNGYGLNTDKNFQLALDGGDTDDPFDAGCTTQDSALAGMVPGDTYSSGFWNWGATQLTGPTTCNASAGGEGVWNYAGVYSADPPVTSDSTGAFSYEATLSELPSGDYVVKANVKEVTGALPGTAWESKLSGLDYLRFTIPGTP